MSRFSEEMCVKLQRELVDTRVGLDQLNAELDRLRTVNAGLTKAIEKFLAEWDNDGIAASDIRRFRAALAAAKGEVQP